MKLRLLAIIFVLVTSPSLVFSDAMIDRENAEAELALFKKRSALFMNDVDLYRQSAEELFGHMDTAIAFEVADYTSQLKETLDINKALLDLVSSSPTFLSQNSTNVLNKYRDLMIAVSELKSEANRLRNRIEHLKSELDSIPQYPVTYFEDVLGTSVSPIYADQINFLNKSVAASLVEVDKLVLSGTGIVSEGYISNIEGLIDSTYKAYASVIETLNLTSVGGAVRSDIKKIEKQMNALNGYSLRIVTVLAEGDRLDRLVTSDYIFSAKHAYDQFNTDYQALYNDINQDETLNDDPDVKYYLSSLIREKRRTTTKLIFGTENLEIGDTNFDMEQEKIEDTKFRKLFTKYMGNDQINEKGETMTWLYDSSGVLNGCKNGEVTILKRYGCQTLVSLVGITSANISALTTEQKRGIEKVLIKVNQGPMGGYEE